MKLNKTALIMEIINPVMEEQGLKMVYCKKGEWKWEKEILGSMECVEISDYDGYLDLVIGNRKGKKQGMGRNLLSTIKEPRTTKWDWAYKDKSDKSNREELYRNIILDFRDILIVNCEKILNENAITVKNRVPNSKHFEMLCNTSTEISKKSYEELAADRKDDLEIAYSLMAKVASMHGQPIEEVEEELVLYASVIEYIIMKLDNIRKKINYDYENIVLSKYDKNGYVCHSMNVLLEIFGAWERPELLEGRQRCIKKFFEK